MPHSPAQALVPGRNPLFLSQSNLLWTLSLIAWQREAQTKGVHSYLTQRLLSRHHQGVSSHPGPRVHPSPLGLSNPLVLPQQPQLPRHGATPRQITTCLSPSRTESGLGEESSVSAEAGARTSHPGAQPCFPRAAAAPARSRGTSTCLAPAFPRALQDRGEAVIITVIALRDCFLVPYLPRGISSPDLITGNYRG